MQDGNSPEESVVDSQAAGSPEDSPVQPGSMPSDDGLPAMLDLESIFGAMGDDESAPASADSADDAPPPAAPGTPDGDSQPPADAQETPAPADNEAPTDPEDESYRKRFIDTRKWGMEKSKEAADRAAEVQALRAELEQLKHAQATPPANPNPQALPTSLNVEELERIADEEGFVPMLNKFGAQLQSQIMGTLDAQRAEESARAQAERQQVERETRVRQVVNDAAEMFRTAKVTPAEFETLSALQHHETQRGFEPSPGALLALSRGGGDWPTVLSLIEAGRQAQEGAPKPPHPGIPGGSVPTGPSRPDTRYTRKVDVGEVF